MIRVPPRSTQSRSSAAADVYKRQDDGNVQQIFRRGERLLRILRQQEIAVGSLGIQPVVRGKGQIGADAGDDIHHHAILVDTVIRGLRAIHIDAVSYTHLTLPTIYSV